MDAADFGIYVLIALQLAVIVMLQHVYSHRQIRALGELLRVQSERIAGELQVSIEKGSTAARAAYKEANSVNLKIEHLNQQLLDQQPTKAK